jgi:hypothetical protein
MKTVILKDKVVYHLVEILKCCGYTCCPYQVTLHTKTNTSLDIVIKKVIYEYLSCKCNISCGCLKGGSAQVGKRTRKRIEEIISKFTNCCGLTCSC